MLSSHFFLGLQVVAFKKISPSQFYNHSPIHRYRRLFKYVSIEQCQHMCKDMVITAVLNSPVRKIVA
jgi:hypothetical protein